MSEEAWLRVRSRPAARAKSPTHNTFSSLQGNTLAAYSSDEDKTAHSREPIVYSRRALLSLYHKHALPGLPTELLGHDASHEHDWEYAGHQDHRSRHRTLPDHHAGMGAGRLSASLRGKGGGGLKGGVLSIGSSQVKEEEVSRPRGKMTDDSPAADRWTSRLQDKSQPVRSPNNAWRTGVESSSETEGSHHSNTHDAAPSPLPAWAEEDPPTTAKPAIPLPAFASANKSSSTASPPISAQNAPEQASSVASSSSDNKLAAVEHDVHSMRKGTSHVSALSLEDEIYEDPLLKRRQHTGSVPLSRSSSARGAFSAPGASSSATAPTPLAQWSYRDPAGSTQGPFSAAQMQEWYEQGFFPDQLLINRVGEPDFVPLSVLIRIVDDSLKPFTSRLRTQPVISHLHSPLPQAQQIPVPQTRKFTNDYDPFTLARSQALPPHSLPPSQHEVYGNIAYTHAQGSVDPWGMPVHQPLIAPSPAPHQQAPHQQNSWQSSSASSSRQASYTQPVSNVEMFGQSRDHMARVPHHGYDMHAVSRSGSLFDEAEALLRQAEPQPILTQSYGGPHRFSVSPTASTSNISSLEISNEHSDSLVATSELSRPTSYDANVAEMAGPLEDYKAEVAAHQPHAISLGSPEAVPPTAKGRSKRQAAKEAREAARKTAQEATVTPPSDLPPTTPPQTRDRGKDRVDAAPTSIVGWESSEPQQTTSSPAASPSASKKNAAPWATGAAEEKPVPGSSSLRDIQATEVKHLQARKAVERQQKAAVNAAEALQSATALESSALSGSSSWGTSPETVQQASPWSRTPAAPANGAASIARPLKDIQAEEARRKQAVRAAAPQPGTGTPPRAAYAGSVGSAQAKAAIAPSGPWMTVGVGGKVGTPASGSSRASPASTSQSKANSAAPTRPAGPLKSVSSNAVRSAAVNGSESAPPAPSPELVRWTRSSLLGFQANVDDFVQLLFSFPLEPDDFTLEIISDTVYANSKTLDGKRFASEFLSRRRADARGITGGKISSMADAVKSPQVKQTAEPFIKVVKVKGKKTSGSR